MARPDRDRALGRAARAARAQLDALGPARVAAQALCELVEAHVRGDAVQQRLEAWCDGKPRDPSDGDGPTPAGLRALTGADDARAVIDGVAGALSNRGRRR